MAKAYKFLLQKNSIKLVGDKVIEWPSTRSQGAKARQAFAGKKKVLQFV